MYERTILTFTNCPCEGPPQHLSTLQTDPAQRSLQMLSSLQRTHEHRGGDCSGYGGWEICPSGFGDVNVDSEPTKLIERQTGETGKVGSQR